MERGWALAEAITKAGGFQLSRSGIIAFAKVSTITPNDVVRLRAGSYAAPPGGVLSTPSTLRATRGEAIVHFP